MLISEEELERRAAELKARLSEREIGYIAGLIDGEGCFTISINKRARGYYIYVFITNTNPEVLNYVQSKLKIGKIICPKRNPRKDNWKDIYMWYIEGINALVFSKAFLDALLIKRAQAELLLKYIDVLGQRGSRVPPEIKRRRDELYWQFRILNIKGRPLGPTALAPSIPSSPFPLRWSLPRPLTLLDV